MQMTRRELREQAFLLIYQRMFGGGEEIMEEKECSMWEYEENEFTTKLVTETEANALLIDAEIEKYLKGWKLSRITSVSRAALRMGICEIEYLKTPAAIVINEIVELVKKYSVQPDPSFVNGVLSSFVKENACETANNADGAEEIKA